MSNKNISIYVILLSLLMLVGMGVLWVMYGWVPPAKSTLAPVIDKPFYFVTWASVVLTIGVIGTMLYLIWVHRRRHAKEQTPAVTPSHVMEVSWVVIPTLLVLVTFVWGFRAFLHVSIPPPDSYEIYVTGKKWLWEFQYANGTVSNELVAPVDRPVKLIMTSTDVLHSFYVPEFRIKHDVIPNRYTTVWFEATEETSSSLDEIWSEEHQHSGAFIQVFCTEYCGQAHSTMSTRLHVVSQDVFDTWLATGGKQEIEINAETGARLYTQYTCNACHSLDGTQGAGPTFQGLFGKQEQLDDGSSVAVDEEYLRESIVLPGAKIVNGYQNVMPIISLSDDEVLALIEYIKEQ